MAKIRMNLQTAQRKNEAIFGHFDEFIQLKLRLAKRVRPCYNNGIMCHMEGRRHAMSIKKKIASILFGQKSEETKEERPRPQAEQQEQEPAETLDFVQEDPALIKLPGEIGRAHV